MTDDPSRADPTSASANPIDPVNTSGGGGHGVDDSSGHSCEVLGESWKGTIDESLKQIEEKVDALEHNPSDPQRGTSFLLGLFSVVFAVVLALATSWFTARAITTQSEDETKRAYLERRDDSLGDFLGEVARVSENVEELARRSVSRGEVLRMFARIELVQSQALIYATTPICIGINNVRFSLDQAHRSAWEAEPRDGEPAPTEDRLAEIRRLTDTHLERLEENAANLTRAAQETRLEIGEPYDFDECIASCGHNERDKNLPHPPAEGEELDRHDCEKQLAFDH